MNPRPTPRRKSNPPNTDRAAAAERPRHLRLVGAPKGVAEGVPSALLSDPGDPTPDQPGIRIYAAPVYRSHYDGARWSKRTDGAPNAAYACACGQTGTATGLDTVAVLVAEYDHHKTTCTGTRVPLTEGRGAA